MPQLMPFYWVNSVFVILYVLMTLIFFYYYKNTEGMIKFNYNKDLLNKYMYMW